MAVHADGQPENIVPSALDITRHSNCAGDLALLTHLAQSLKIQKIHIKPNKFHIMCKVLCIQQLCEVSPPIDITRHFVSSLVMVFQAFAAAIGFC